MALQLSRQIDGIERAAFQQVSGRFHDRHDEHRKRGRDHAELLATNSNIAQWALATIASSGWHRRIVNGAARRNRAQNGSIVLLDRGGRSCPLELFRVPAKWDGPDFDAEKATSRSRPGRSHEGIEGVRRRTMFQTERVHFAVRLPTTRTLHRDGLMRARQPTDPAPGIRAL